jgi:hypothetical protein
VSVTPVPYLANAERFAKARDNEARRSTRIARLRLATFLPAAFLVIWALSHRLPPLPIVTAVVLFAAFAVLVVWHARVDDRLNWYEALRLVNVRGLARRARDWNVLPEADAPLGVDINQHPYALDLDLFGRASLAQWLGPAATAGGRLTLANWLLRATELTEIDARQEAVAELAAHDDWRESFSAHGVLTERVRQAELDRFLAWAEGDDSFGWNSRLMRIAVVIVLVSIWLLIALHATGVWPTAVWAIPLAAGWIWSFAMAHRIETTLDRAGAGQSALGRYAGLLEHAVAVPSSSPRLAAIRQRLSAAGMPAPRCMRKLNRILGYGEFRRSAALLHLPIQALTLWDFHVMFALDRWRRANGAHVREWLQAVGELDALALFASVRRDNPEWAFPEFGSQSTIEGEAVGHPLIPDDRRVANDVTVGPPGTLLLITGSNMSGKSTLLRAIGLNVVLAQTGGCVCARRFRMRPADLQTSIRVQDSLELGLSYFMAALARLKGVVDAAEHEREGRVLVYLLDEILQGTNSAERSVAVRAVARHLLEAGAIGAMTSHDLALAAEEPLKDAARLVHFTEIVDAHGGMAFDYKLRPGLATSRNALRLMQLIGIDL